MEGLAPTSEEFEVIKGFTGDINLLDLPSRWIYEMRTVRIFKTRISMYKFMQEFP